MTIVGSLQVKRRLENSLAFSDQNSNSRFTRKVIYFLKKVEPWRGDDKK